MLELSLNAASEAEKTTPVNPVKPVGAIVCQAATGPRVPSLQRPIFEAVSLTIAPGEWVSLLGFNGAGKSTLLRAMVGLVPLTSGQLWIHQRPVHRRTLPQVRRQVGMLFQGGGLVKPLTAMDNVLCGRLSAYAPWQTLMGFGRADRLRALDLLAEMGLREQADQKTSQLSGGQQQRVAIARALIQNPQILLADEPTTGLDVQGIRQVMDTFRDLNRRGMTIVTVLHDLELAATYTQRAIVLEQGRVIHDGDPRHLPSQFCAAAPAASFAGKES